VKEMLKNSKWLRYLIIGGGLLLIIAAVLRAITPKVEPIPETDFVTQNVGSLASNFKNITYGGEDITPPKEFLIVKAENASTDSTQIAQKLIQDFSLKPNVKTSNLWSSNQGSLYFNQESNQYELDLGSSDSLQSGGQGINKDQAVQAAQKFLEKYIPHSDTLKVDDSRIAFITGELDLEETTAEKAEVVSLPFSFFVDGFPILFKNLDVLPFEVNIDSRYQIKRFAFFPLFYTFTTVQKSPSLSIGQAIRNINQQKASILSVENETHGPMNLERIQSGKMDRVLIEYHFDDKLQVAYPFYRFAGKVTDDTNRTYSVEVITPAVETLPAAK
jgi:hypothetical protein